MTTAGRERGGQRMIMRRNKLREAGEDDQKDDHDIKWSCVADNDQAVAIGGGEELSVG